MLDAAPEGGDAEGQEEGPGEEPDEVLGPVKGAGEFVEVGGGTAAEKAEDVLVPEVEPDEAVVVGVAGLWRAARMCQGAAMARKRRRPVRGRSILSLAEGAGEEEEEEGGGGEEDEGYEALGEDGEGEGGPEEVGVEGAGVGDRAGRSEGWGWTHSHGGAVMNGHGVGGSRESVLEVQRVC